MTWRKWAINKLSSNSMNKLWICDVWSCNNTNILRQDMFECEFIDNIKESYSDHQCYKVLFLMTRRFSIWQYSYYYKEKGKKWPPTNSIRYCIQSCSLTEMIDKLCNVKIHKDKLLGVKRCVASFSTPLSFETNKISKDWRFL